VVSVTDPYGRILAFLDRVSGIYRCIIRGMATDVSEENIASNFGFEE
jgi:hypothetical protein